VHGAYYLLMHAWLAVGSSPAVLRIPSVIAMTVAAALVAVTGRRLTGSAWAGAFAGVITAVTPAISYYAQTARSYALVFACVTGSTLVLVHALRAEADGRPAARRWAAYAVLIAASGYLNELALLVLTAHAVTVLLARYGRRALARWAIAGAAGAVLVTPVIVVSTGETGAVTWISPPDAANLLLLFHDYFGAMLVVAAALVVCAVVALLPQSGAPAWWRAGGLCVQSVAVPLLIVPAAVLIAESVVARPFYVDRYLLYGEAGAALLAAAGACRIGQWLRGRLAAAAPARQRALLLAPGIALCAGALVLQASAQRYDRTPGSREFNFGGPSQYVGAHARAGDGVLYLGAFFRKGSLAYPQDYTKVTDFGLAVSPAAAGSFQGIDKRFAVVAPLMLRYQRIWTVGRAPLSLRLPPGLIRSEGRFLKKHFTRASRTDFRGVVVTLWVRG
jgi:mannosyltransferase